MRHEHLAPDVEIEDEDGLGAARGIFNAILITIAGIPIVYVLVECLL